MKETIRQWIHAQIEQWAEDNFESAEAWSKNKQDHQDNERNKKSFIKLKKEEFDELFK